MELLWYNFLLIYAFIFLFIILEIMNGKFWGYPFWNFLLLIKNKWFLSHWSKIVRMKVISANGADHLTAFSSLKECRSSWFSLGKSHVSVVKWMVLWHQPGKKSLSRLVREFGYYFHLEEGLGRKCHRRESVEEKDKKYNYIINKWYVCYNRVVICTFNIICTYNVSYMYIIIG